MTTYLFPDNTVLCNFATVRRLDLLAAVLNGRGRWTAAVEYEASRSAQHLPDLERLQQEGWLDEPVEITDDGHQRQVEGIRRAVFGGTEDKPLQHLGEAETCFVIREWVEFAGSWWISDDRDALRYARFQKIQTYETMDLVSLGVANGDVTAKDGFALLNRMADEGRSLRLPRTAADLGR